MNKEQVNSFLGIIIVVLLFIISSVLVQKYLNELSSYLDFGFVGMLVYIFINILAIVVAPVSVMPLMPLASNLWGWYITGVLSIIGWFIGAWIAFVLARKYGVDLINKFINMNKIQKLERLIPEEHLFLGIVFFRMFIPVDGLSYFLGLFSKVKLNTYLLATLIGITPFAFSFAYLGTVPIFYQLTIFGVVAITLMVGAIIYYARHKPLKKVSKTKKKK